MPSGLLEFVLQLNASQYVPNKGDSGPLKLLLHHQQPLSYLEQLIQTELHMPGQEGEFRMSPSITFCTPLAASIDPTTSEATVRGEGQCDHAESNRFYAEDGPQGVGAGEFLHWHASTELSHFLQAAAKSGRFHMVIEGRTHISTVAVPSFDKQTSHPRRRLSQLNKQVALMDSIQEQFHERVVVAARRMIAASTGGPIIYYLSHQVVFGGHCRLSDTLLLLGSYLMLLGSMRFPWNSNLVYDSTACKFPLHPYGSRANCAQERLLRRRKRASEEAYAVQKGIEGIARAYGVNCGPHTK